MAGSSSSPFSSSLLIAYIKLAGEWGMSLVDPLKINCHGQQSFFSTLLNVTPLWSWRQNQMHADRRTHRKLPRLDQTNRSHHTRSFPPFLPLLFISCTRTWSQPFRVELCLVLYWRVRPSCVSSCLDKLALIMYVRTSAKTCSKNGMDFFFYVILSVCLA